MKYAKCKTDSTALSSTNEHNNSSNCNLSKSVRDISNESSSPNDSDPDKVKVIELKLISPDINNIDSITTTDSNANRLNQIEIVSKSSDSLETAPKTNEIITSSNIQSLETENDDGNAAENEFLENVQNPEIAEFLRSPSAQTQIRNPEKEECDELDEIAPKSRISIITDNDPFFFFLNSLYLHHYYTSNKLQKNLQIQIYR